MQITFTIPEDKLQDVTDAILFKFAVPMTDGVPDFTDSAWSKEALRRMIVNIVHQHKRTLATQLARTAAVKDDGVIQ